MRYHISRVWPSQSSAGNSITPALPCGSPAPLSPFPPPMSLSWSALAQWRVSSNLSCPSKRNQDEMAGALGHQPPCYLNHQHLRLHNGRFWERAGGWKKAIYSQGIQEKKARRDPATVGGRAALIMTIPWEDNLHYISGGRQPLREEKAAVNAMEYTRLMLLEGFGKEGLWLPVQAAQRTSHEIAYGMHAGHSRL